MPVACVAQAWRNGCSLPRQVARRGQAARLQPKRGVELVVHADGIRVDDGPFRCGSSPRRRWPRASCARQTVLGPAGAVVCAGASVRAPLRQRARTEARDARSARQDVLEGFFPIEFKERFPHGVVFHVRDLSTTRFAPHIAAFGGRGRALGRKVRVATAAARQAAACSRGCRTSLLRAQGGPPAWRTLAASRWCCLRLLAPARSLLPPPRHAQLHVGGREFLLEPASSLLPHAPAPNAARPPSARVDSRAVPLGRPPSASAAEGAALSADNAVSDGSVVVADTAGMIAAAAAAAASSLTHGAVCRALRAGATDSLGDTTTLQVQMSQALVPRPSPTRVRACVRVHVCVRRSSQWMVRRRWCSRCCTRTRWGRCGRPSTLTGAGGACGRYPRVLPSHRPHRVQEQLGRVRAAHHVPSPRLLRPR